MEGHLFGAVIVILIRGMGLAAIETEGVYRAGSISRIHRVGIVREQYGGQSVHGGRVGSGDELGFAGWIFGMRIGAEVVVERDVFREDHDEMLDRSNRLGGLLRFENKSGSREQARESERGEGAVRHEVSILWETLREWDVLDICGRGQRPCGTL